MPILARRTLIESGSRAALPALAVALLFAYGFSVRQGPALADEFIYLAGARHFAETGRLDARFYDADAILSVGHPHQDVHTPGYVIVLGATIALFGGSNRTAVAMNTACYLVSAWLVLLLARDLGMTARSARASSILYLLLPLHLAYVFWAMAELLLGCLFLLALWVSVRHGRSLRGAVAAGMALGLATLVRESTVLGIPILLAALPGWRSRRWLLGAFGAILLLVYLPLSVDRAPGGANFWRPASGPAFAGGPLRSALQGDLTQAVALAAERARWNLAQVAGPATGWTERGLLLLYIVVPAWALCGWRRLGARERRMLFAATCSLTLVLGLLFSLYVLGSWSGIRYLMFLIPAFLPFVDRERRAGTLAVALFVGFCVALQVGTGITLDAYKKSRQERQQRLTAYVERYVHPRSVSRIVLVNGWHFGLAHYPVEVISSLPSAGGGALRQLERSLWFEILALPANSPLSQEWDARGRYRRLNADDCEAQLALYRRRR